MSRRTVGLTAIVALALAVRIAWIFSAGHPLPISDPDGYIPMARLLADGSHGWHWTFVATQYVEFHKAPLYQTALSILTAHPSTFPLSGVLAHAVLDSSICVSMYFLGRSVHSDRAGLVAALIYALWVPRIVTVTGFWQEQLFVPLLVAGFALLAWAIDQEGSRRHWAIAGAVLGLAALTRSSVTYFLIPAALLHIWWAQDPRRALRQCGWWMGAFLLVVAPYTMLLSAHLGRFVAIEDIAFFNLKRSGSAASPSITTYMANAATAPTTGEAVRYLAGALTRDPFGYLAERAGYGRLALKPSAAAWISAVATPTAGAALSAKWLLHIVEDLPFVVIVVLAPFGAVLARRREVARLLVLWGTLYILLLSMTLFAGSRYREPASFSLIVLASVAMAGQWAQPRRPGLRIAALVSAALAITIGISLPGVLAVQANYGVPYGPIGPDAADVRVVGRAGVNVIAGYPKLTLTFQVDPDAPVSARQPVRVVVKLSGRKVDELVIAGDKAHQVRYPVDAGVHYVEFIASKPDGSPATVLVTLPM